MEFAGMAETYARKFGHQGKIRTRHYQTEGYPWHILSGTNSARVGLLDAAASGKGTSAAFPVGAGNKKLSRSESIMVDMGLVLNGYHKVSFIGHGIGLEIVEPPFIAKNRKEPLEPGMTLGLEPKMV